MNDRPICKLGAKCKEIPGIPGTCDQWFCIPSETEEAKKADQLYNKEISEYAGFPRDRFRMVLPPISAVSELFFTPSASRIVSNPGVISHGLDCFGILVSQFPSHGIASGPITSVMWESIVSSACPPDYLNTKNATLSWMWPTGNVVVMRGVYPEALGVNGAYLAGGVNMTSFENSFIRQLNVFRKEMLAGSSLVVNGVNVGMVSPPPMVLTRPLFLSAAWSEERFSSREWDDKYPGVSNSDMGRCYPKPSLNQYCGSTFLPTVIDQVGYLRSGEPPVTSTGEDEFVFDLVGIHQFTLKAPALLHALVSEYHLSGPVDSILSWTQVGFSMLMTSPDSIKFRFKFGGVRNAYVPPLPNSFVANAGTTFTPSDSRVIQTASLAHGSDCVTQHIPKFVNHGINGSGISNATWSTAPYVPRYYNTRWNIPNTLLWLYPTGNPSVMRGIYDIPGGNNYFVNPASPTLLEVEDCFLRQINRFRNVNLAGAFVNGVINGPVTQMTYTRPLFLLSAWSDERRWSTHYDTAYTGVLGSNGGPCVGLTNGNNLCGSSFVPGGDCQQPYLRTGEAVVTGVTGSFDVVVDLVGNYPFSLIFPTIFYNLISVYHFTNVVDYFLTRTQIGISMVFIGSSTIRFRFRFGPGYVPYYIG